MPKRILRSKLSGMAPIVSAFVLVSLFSCSNEPVPTSADEKLSYLSSVCRSPNQEKFCANGTFKCVKARATSSGRCRSTEDVIIAGDGTYCRKKRC